MSFIMTPTNFDLIDNLFKDIRTGKWIFPVYTFNTGFINPYYGEVDPLNEDPVYQKSVIDNFYLRLKEKWLYKDPNFRKLLKYFVVEENGDNGTITLVSDPDKAAKNDLTEKYRNHVLRYIEKYFVTKKFVKKTLKQYVNSSHIKWYDLFHNIDSVKELLAHKLKKLIISTIYELQERKAVKKIDNDKAKKTFSLSDSDTD